MSFIYPKQFRLRKPSEFQRVLKKSKRFTHQCVKARVNFNEHLQHPMLGIAVTKKMVKHAVVRNRIKRIIREIFRHSYPELPKCSCVIFVVTSNIITLTNKEITSQLNKLFEQIQQHQIDYLNKT